MSADAGAAWPRYVTPDRLYRLSVVQYHKMIEFGILTNDDRVELIEGFLVRKMPESPAHDRTVKKAGETLTNVLSHAFGGPTVEHLPVADLLG